MRFTHFVLERYVILILHLLDSRPMRFVRILGFKRRQGEAAAADHRFARAEDYVSAYRASIELRAQHIEGTVRVHNILPREKLYHRNAE